MSRCGCLATCVCLLASSLKIGATQNDSTTPIDEQNTDDIVNQNKSGVVNFLPFAINNKCEFNITFENGKKLWENEYRLKNFTDFRNKPKGANTKI